MGDDNNRGSDWTVNTLKEHLDSLRQDDKAMVQSALLSSEKAINAALIAAERAVSKAEAATEKRFDSVNEFRQSLADQARLAKDRESDFLPRREFLVQHENLQTAINSLSQQVDNTAIDFIHRREYTAQYQSLAAMVAENSRRLDNDAGRRQGVGMSASTIVSSIAVLAAVVAIFVGVFTVFNGTRALPVTNPVTYIPTVTGQTLIAPSAQHK